MDLRPINNKFLVFLLKSKIIWEHQNLDKTVAKAAPARENLGIKIRFNIIFIKTPLQVLMLVPKKSSLA